MAYMFKEGFLPKASVRFKPATSAYYCLLLMFHEGHRWTNILNFYFFIIYTYYINVIFLALEFLFKEFFHT